MNENTARSEEASASTGATYRLTVKRGLLALVIMHAAQILVGMGVSWGAKSLQSGDGGRGALDLPVIGVISVLGGGFLTLLWIWRDVLRFGPRFPPQIGVCRGVIDTSRAALLVVALLVATHVLAWGYRSGLLPALGRAEVVGGGSQVFAHVRDSGSIAGMAAFLVLALVVGPVVEELVFRGYLQSALNRRMSAWKAIAITSLAFMVGHGPMILWPMYFLYSATWGWVFAHTKSVAASIAFHVLNNAFYTVVGFMGWRVFA